jgi:hypothetical protein
VRIRRITSHSLQAIAEGALIAMLVVGLMAGSAFAARGGPVRTTATLSAACPCDVSTPISFTGTGFDGTKALAMLSFNGATTSTNVSADGTIAHSWPYFTVAGTYWVRAYQSGKGGKMTLKAETYVTVN